MNLREQLRHLLPEILPDDPAEAIKGTELIRLVRHRLGEGPGGVRRRVEFLETAWYESTRAGIEPALLLGLIQVESGFRRYAISSAGARTVLANYAALGAGNGALFQLVPLRWPMSTAVAGSMIGEIGALGGGLVPAMMGQAKQHTDSFLPGFVAMALFSLLMLAVMRKMQVRWTRTWAEKGGRARTTGSTAAAFHQPASSSASAP